MRAGGPERNPVKTMGAGKVLALRARGPDLTFKNQEQYEVLAVPALGKQGQVMSELTSQPVSHNQYSI